MKHVGNEIERLINRMAIKKKDFAKIVGMSDVNLSKIFKKNSIDAELLERFAKALNVPVSYFFDDVPAGGMVASGSGIIQNNGVNHGNVSIQISQQAAEIERLKSELASCRELLKSKDKIIELLEKQIK